MHHLDVGIGSMTAGMCDEQPHHDVLSKKRVGAGDFSLVVWLWKEGKGEGGRVGVGERGERTAFIACSWSAHICRPFSLVKV